MPKVAYIQKNFNEEHMSIIQTANSIIAAYARQGFDLTLRQLYYQFVSRDLIPNKDKEYKRLGSIINDARLAGLIDWEAITDRTRNLRGNSHWDSPGDIIQTAAQSYRVSLWEDQPCRVEVWIEKDALVGVIDGVCREFDVPFFSCRGYTSQSEMWAAAQRLDSYERNGQATVVLHLGDHDPSGIDMSRDIQERLNLFGAETEVRRIALNMMQIQAYNPPPNPAKITDARAKGYIKKFGDESWELDALTPQTIVQLIRDTVEEYIDQPSWKEALQKQEEEKRLLKTVASRWDQITSSL